MPMTSGGVKEESVALATVGPRLIAGDVFQAHVMSSLGSQSRLHRD